MIQTPEDTPLQTSPVHTYLYNLTSILILFSHRNTSLRRKLFPSSSQIKTVHVFNNLSVRFTSLVHLMHTEDAR